MSFGNIRALSRFKLETVPDVDAKLADHVTDLPSTYQCAQADPFLYALTPLCPSISRYKQSRTRSANKDSDSIDKPETGEFATSCPGAVRTAPRKLTFTPSNSQLTSQVRHQIRWLSNGSMRLCCFSARLSWSSPCDRLDLRNAGGDDMTDIDTYVLACGHALHDAQIKCQLFEESWYAAYHYDHGRLVDDDDCFYYFQQ